MGSPGELKQLRRIDQVVRLGRVQKLERDRIILEKGVVPTQGNTLYIDCSSDGLVTRPVVPVFQEDRIILQAVAICQQVFSAAIIGHIEARGGTDQQKNAYCLPVPHPDRPEDQFDRSLIVAKNEDTWNANRDMRNWMKQSRLNSLRKLQSPGFLELLLLARRNVGRLPMLLDFRAKLKASSEKILKN